MKRFFLFFLVLVLFTGTAAAEDADVFASGDFEYTILDDGTVCLKDYTGKASELTIPAELDGRTVTAIGDGMFSGSSLTSVSIPDSVTSIGRGAFAVCDSLTEVTIPDSVTSMGIGVFAGCDGLTAVTLPDGITTIGMGTFEGCWSLTSVTIPDRVTSIGDYVFRGCDSLKSITIPDSVTSIGEGVFADCANLTSISIPDSLTDIGDNAFGTCENVIRRQSSPQGSRSAEAWTCEACGKTGEGNFCANCGAAKPAGQSNDAEAAAELLYSFSVPLLENLDWENIDGWDEEDRAMASVFLVFALSLQKEYSGEYTFDWENMYSGPVRSQSGDEDFILVTADGDDVLLLEWSDDETVCCLRLNGADPSDMRAVAGSLERTPPAEDLVVYLTRNNSKLMEKYLNAILGEED